MPDNVKIWTANQVKAQRWLAMPSAERAPTTQGELAAEIGINEATLTRWKAQPGFMDAVYAIAEEYLGGDMHDIYLALRREAKAGSYQHIKLALELTGRYVERKEITGADGAPLLVIDR